MTENKKQNLNGRFSLRGKVYFIYQYGDDTRCKIGKSIHPNERKGQLQTGNPDELYIYETLIGYSSLEKTLHKKCKEKQIRNTEWFYLTKEEVDIIVESYVSGKSLDVKNFPKKDMHKEQQMNNSLKCDKCNKTFSGERYLKRHVNGNICTKKYICNKCKKEFSTAYNLRAHLKRRHLVFHLKYL